MYQRVRSVRISLEALYQRKCPDCERGLHSSKFGSVASSQQSWRRLSIETLPEVSRGTINQPTAARRSQFIYLHPRFLGMRLTSSTRYKGSMTRALATRISGLGARAS